MIEKKEILFILPPFTQLNTPYPAAPYLTRYLSEAGYAAAQSDCGILLARKIYSRTGLSEIFTAAESSPRLTARAQSVLKIKDAYIDAVDNATAALSMHSNALARKIITGTVLPELRYSKNDALLSRFSDDAVMEKSRFIATAFLGDIAAFIADTIDPQFSLTRYAEKLSQSPASFTPVQNEVERESLITQFYNSILDEEIKKYNPAALAVSIPFPGTLIYALRTLKFIAQKYPSIYRIAGGGYVNTELREISDPSFFDYAQYLTFDDGELPLRRLLDLFRGAATEDSLVRTRYRKDMRIIDSGNADENIQFDETGWPDYSGIQICDYFSMSDAVNPMISLWNTDFWIKMTLAHGCYWKQCTFCDTSLDYINRYKPLNAQKIADRIERLIIETGQRSFHFVDEAAPPALLRNLSIELLQRKISISWWTNIRFDKAFTPDLARLLSLAGCIAVSGGLEAANDNTLKRMKKGVTLGEAAAAARNLSEAGIMVHAYLIYAFPGQSEQDIVDSLEAVRQLFAEGFIRSAYYHRFSLTRHSECGMYPENFGISKVITPQGTFANNDLEYIDSFDYSRYGDGISRALFNFNNLNALDKPINEWFAFKTPKPRHSQGEIERISRSPRSQTGNVLIWTGSHCEYSNRNGKDGLLICDAAGEEFILCNAAMARIIAEHLPHFTPGSGKSPADFLKLCGDSTEEITRSDIWEKLQDEGLILVV